jgi:hypothetical protein
MSQHSAKMDRKSLPPSLIRRNSSSITIRSVDVPAATIVADEFAVFTVQVAEERMRLSLTGATLGEAVGDVGKIDTWTVMKRYSSMRTFHRGLRRHFGHTRRPKSKKKEEAPAARHHNGGEEKQGQQRDAQVPDEFEIPLPSFPSKKWFGNRSPRFVEQRRGELAVYFSKLLVWAKVGVTTDVRMSMLREYLTFSDPEVAQHRMFSGIHHGPKAASPPASLEHKRVGGDEEGGEAKRLF